MDGSFRVAAGNSSVFWTSHSHQLISTGNERSTIKEEILYSVRPCGHELLFRGIDPSPAQRPRRCHACQASLEWIGGSVRVDLWADEGDQGDQGWEGWEGKAQRTWLSDSQCVDVQVSRADRRPSLSTKDHAGESSTTQVHARVLNCSRTVHTHNGIFWRVKHHGEDPGSRHLKHQASAWKSNLNLCRCHALFRPAMGCIAV